MNMYILILVMSIKSFERINLTPKHKTITTAATLEPLDLETIKHGHPIININNNQQLSNIQHKINIEFKKT